MNKKKITIALCAIAIAGIVTVGGSLAYFTDRTDVVKNTFVTDSKDLNGEIIETFDEEKAEQFLPGDVIYKVPSLSNDQDSISAWAAIKLDIKVNDVTVSYDEFKEQFATISYLSEEGFNLNDYELIQGDYSNKDSLVFIYKNIVEPGTTTSAIFDSVNVNTGCKIVVNSKYKNSDIYKEVDSSEPNAVKLSDGKYYVLIDTSRELFDANTTYYVVNADGSLTVVDVDYELPKFEIEVKGYMIQSDNVDYATAKTELAALVNRNSGN